MSPASGVPQDEHRNTPVSALPSQLARALAFTAIVVGGLAGAVIGYGVAKVQCSGDCSAQKAAGSILGALFIGIGIAIVAVLVLRAMGEWNAVKERGERVVLGSRQLLRTPIRPAGSDSSDDSGSSPPHLSPEISSGPAPSSPTPAGAADPSPIEPEGTEPS